MGILRSMSFTWLFFTVVVLFLCIETIFARSISRDFDMDLEPISSNSAEDFLIKRAPMKRRLVVRLPYAQKPDSLQLGRIYKSIYSQPKEKKFNAEPLGFSLQRLFL
uniref:Uncharacterized protein n=1 Tax=Acrobeloides nanus TaxID=290746 RepID=A0A914BY92_9BILA